MKVKEFLKDHNIDLETEDDCNLCRLHDLFTLKIPNLCCPKCGHPIDFLDGDSVPVGSRNFVDPDDEIRNMIHLGACSNCNEHMALAPVNVIWNANHDVYYTGGRSYLLHTEAQAFSDKFKEKLLPLIENFVERRDKGETLTASQLLYWLDGKVQDVIAETLVEHGMKLP